MQRSSDAQDAHWLSTLHFLWVFRHFLQLNGAQSEKGHFSDQGGGKIDKEKKLVMHEGHKNRYIETVGMAFH